ncbi:MAG: hypothetical protein KAT70_03200 [Thermoplasmata archaeon]|nr:hypothetical protein [Thermoplasmata archaeon]
MNWATIKEAIRQAAIAATGLEDASVQWMDTVEAGVWTESPWCELLLRSPGSIGVDEYRHTYNAYTDSLEHTVEGVRTFVVSFRLHSESQVGGETALGQLASNLRTRLRRPSVKALLLAVDVALARMESTVDAGYNGDGRSVSLSITDVLFSASETDADTTADGAYIHTVEMSPTEGSELDITLVVSTEEDPVSFNTVHFNIGKLGSPSVAPTPGTPDPAAMAIFSQLNISTNRAVSVLHLHGVEDQGSGTMTVEVYRRRDAVLTLMGSLTLPGGGGDFDTAALVPADTLLLAGDYIFAQLTDYSGAGGYDGITVDVHFA